MVMDEDEEDFVYYGTPIEREEETSTRKRKAAADAGHLRSLPVWKQEVRDEEGRKRFHGAFTGGFSAGYYNTVGSKEGWTPQTFTSSRKNRAEVKKQSIYNFLDDEDVKDMGGHALETSMQFDTFGFTAAEVARKEAEKEQQKRPSAIPGPVPDEIVLPAANSIGVKLLLKLGWRHGRSIREINTDSLYDARREARKAFLALSGNDGRSKHDESELTRSDSEDLNERMDNSVYASQSTPVYVLNPKQDLFGLGYDPFKHAPEFRDRKRLLESGSKDRDNRRDTVMRRSLLASNSGKYALGFGIGALEELDIEDEDIYASGFEFEETEVEEDAPKTIKGDLHEQKHRKNGCLSGFKLASNSDYNLGRFHPPDIPSGFEPIHKFPFPLETENKCTEPPPPEVPPPEDHNLRLLIEGFATFVARCGKLFEDLSKEKNRSNPLFSFLNGGNGYNYYARKLWEEKQRRADKQKQLDVKSISFTEKMTAESRGRILGERPLERSSNDSSSSGTYKEVIHLQSNLSDTFTKPASLIGLSESVKPFKNDPAKQERFEQFLRDKYEGGLRSTHSGGVSSLSETDRARERLDFEAAAEAIEKGEWSTETSLPSAAEIGGRHFISSADLEKHQVHQDEEKISTIFPKREEFQWRPSPILCKRFDIVDPFMGKPPPLPRARSKIDTLIFLPDVQSLKPEKASKSVPNSQSDLQEIEKQPTAHELDIERTATSIQRPVDLYKAIFSDDSDDEGENASLNQTDNLEKKTEGANTTLNRLIAGDFLESLGKELGLEVPPDSTYQVGKFNSSASHAQGLRNSPTKEKSASTIQTSSTCLGNRDTAGESTTPENFRDFCAPSKISEMSDKQFASIVGDESNHANSSKGSEAAGVQAQKTEHTADKHRIHSRHHKSRSGSSDTDSSVDRKGDRTEHRASKHRTHSRQHGGRSRSLDSDSSSDHRYRYRSRSIDKKKSLHEKSKKHSKEHSDKRKSTSRYSRHESDMDFTHERREDRKSRDRSHSVYSKSDDHKKYH